MNEIQTLVKQAQDGIDLFNTAALRLDTSGYDVTISRPFTNKVLLKINKK